MTENRQIFTLKQVVGSIRKTIEERYQQTYWVKAEMHKLNLYPSGHAFPELVQKENDRIVAQLSGSIWNHHLEQINQRFILTVKEPLKEGTTLLMQVKVAYSELYGLRLQILDIDPSFTLGELQKEREETLLRLTKEGLLNQNQKLAYPLLPKRVAIVSADTSKGLSDFMKIIANNPWNYQFFTMLFPAYLQGDNAAPSIIEQLKGIEKVKHHFDCVAIVRGGGGEVGLSCYNNYALCKEICSFPLPIISGIGHSTNLTVAEMVSFRNAITPTELGEFLLQAFHEFAVPVGDAVKSIKSLTQLIIEQSKVAFGHETKHFKNAILHFTHEKQTHLLNASWRFNNAAVGLIKSRSEMLNRYNLSISNSFLRKLKNEELTIKEYCEILPQKVKQYTLSKNKELTVLDNFVRLMDPIHVLKRGYTLTTLNGISITNQTTINPGDTLVTKTHNKEIESIIQNIKAHEK
jgi:exodeoxyribonuclease VII large subunit